MAMKWANQNFTQLRQLAEAQLTSAPKLKLRSTEELLHELQIHQIELEMQNDELRRTQLALEESRDRYVGFYDFSPVGYLTLSREGLIAEINLTGATMQGDDRSKLLQRRFAGLVAPEDSDRWHLYFKAVLQQDSKQMCELCIMRVDGTRLHVQLDALRLKIDGNALVARVVLADITERNKAEETEKRLIRALTLLRKTDLVLAQSENEQELLTEVCKLVVETGGYLMSWVGYAEHDACQEYP